MPFIAYFFVLVLTAVTATVSLDYLTAPEISAQKHETAHETAKVAANAPAANAVRQVPLGKTADAGTTGQNGSGDADNSLTPIYPAAPGKDLPKDLPQPGTTDKTDNKTVDAHPANAPAVNAQGGNVQAGNAQAAKPQPVTSQTASAPATLAAGACAIEACASAYRSFRASDCSYQPYDGPRKLCEMSPDGARQASIAPPPSQDAMRDGNLRRARSDDFGNVVRTVRRLPPQADDDDEDVGYDPGYDPGYDGGRVVVIQRQGSGPYGADPYEEGARPYDGPRTIYRER